MVMASDTFTVRPPNRPWKRYLSCKQLSKQQNVPWQDTLAFQSGTFNSLTHLTFGVRFQWANLPHGTELGRFKITWYCTFAGQAYQGR